MNLSDVKLFLLPINAALPPELVTLPTLAGSFSERVAAAEKAPTQSVLPISAAEAATLAAHPEVFNLPTMLFLSHVPGASYDPLVDAAIARLGANVALWDAVKAELSAASIESQRRVDSQPWTREPHSAEGRAAREAASNPAVAKLPAGVSSEDGEADE